VEDDPRALPSRLMEELELHDRGQKVGAKVAGLK
jgi:hypothetical protein